MGVTSKMRGRLACFACAIGPLVLGAASAHDEQTTDPPEQRVSRNSSGWPIGAFALSDHLGKSFTQERLRGRWTFVLLGDTHCADPCGAALTALSRLMQRIATADAVKTTQILFVSLDPEHDTAQRLQQYLAAYDNRFVAATGTRDALAQFVDDISAGEASPAGGASYRGSLVLIGPDGAIRAEYLPPFDTKRLTAEFLKTRARG